MIYGHRQANKNPTPKNRGVYEANLEVAVSPQVLLMNALAALLVVLGGHVGLY